MKSVKGKRRSNCNLRELLGGTTNDLPKGHGHVLLDDVFTFYVMIQSDGFPVMLS